MRELKPGESPFDDWGRERLVRFAQRCYAAMRAAQEVMGLLQMEGTHDLFWTGGTGGKAFALTDAIVREVGCDARSGSVESENLYRAFYRAYLPVLFADAVKRDGSPWFPPRYICDACGTWVQSDAWDNDPAHFVHFAPDCPGTWRVMGPQDLPPVPPVAVE